jgi:ribonuclease kappa
MLSIVAALFKYTCEFSSTVADNSYGAKALVDGLPKDVSGQDAAGTCLATVIVYVVFFLFCGSQVFLSKRQGRIQL